MDNGKERVKDQYELQQIRTQAGRVYLKTTAAALAMTAAAWFL